ncbi:MAG TPA: ABC transporter permease subunit [Mycobacteriales bacterium]|nr:ABC transporter permease subunit [Mycobacteriales bacterium]
MPETVTVSATAEPAALGAGAPRRRRWPSGWSRRLRRIAAVVVPFMLWDFAAAASDNRLFPGPFRVFEELWEQLTDGTLWFHGRVTLLRGLAGLAIAVVVGVLLGVLMATVRWLDAALQPLIVATYPVPKLALFPLLVLLLGFGPASKIAMVALECSYPIILTTYAGVQAIDKHYFWLARNVGAGPLARLQLMLRAASPALMASLRMAAPIMLVVIVVTELIGESRGLGYLIRQAGADFQPATALSIVLLLGIIGFTVDRTIVALSARTTRWAAQVRL